MFRYLTTLLAVVSFWGFASTANAADPQLMAKAAEIAKVCSTHMPNSKAVKSALKDAGYRYEGIMDGLHVYSANSRRVVAATSVTSAEQQGCIVVVSKMTAAEGVALAQPWVNSTRAESVSVRRNNDAAMWLGTVNNRKVTIAVRKQINFRIMRGAAILMVSAN